MGRNRVLSFMSQWSAHRDSRASTLTSPEPKTEPSGTTFRQPSLSTNTSFPNHIDRGTETPSPSSPIRGESGVASDAISNSSATDSPAGRQRLNSRPSSIVQTYQPPVMDVTEDTLPELQPIFTFLNGHQNKLYQEGYFLKLDDQDTRGRPNPDRTWTECFAQLVGTVLSLWDAAELDIAGEDGEVLPKFINLTDASIKMIESLPTRSIEEQPLQNILSVSTAGRNRYLLHFNSHHSLIQWTAAIRLAMFEHAVLQEAYTGALIAGKGKALNNINIIMERSRFKVEAWVRVRFGAGVPWRRCWCVIVPPDEKEYAKLQKERRKRSPYDRSHAPILKGDIRFYETKKEADKKKKGRPIAVITDSYSAYALYPQSRALIDNSTLLKIECHVTIHSEPPSTTEGFVFIMPETAPMVTGFEMLLRFLFPTWDTFGLYGRPGRLVASHLDQRSLMFAMPKHRRYGYLEILDVTGLIVTEGSSSWKEQEWRKRLKELTAQRMAAMDETVRAKRSSSRASKRLSYGPLNPEPTRAPRVNFAEQDGASVRSSRSMSLTSRPAPRTDSAPPDPKPHRLHGPSPLNVNARHSRNISDSQLDAALAQVPSSDDQDGGVFLAPAARIQESAQTLAGDVASAATERVSSEDERPRGTRPSSQGQDTDERLLLHTPEPVNAPPAFSHGANARPLQKPYHSPDMRRATARFSSSTLNQLAKAGGMTPDQFRDEDPLDQRTSGEDSAGSSARHLQDTRDASVQPRPSPSSFLPLQTALSHALQTQANANELRQEAMISPLSSPPEAALPWSPPGPPHSSPDASQQSPRSALGEPSSLSSANFGPPSHFRFGPGSGSTLASPASFPIGGRQQGGLPLQHRDAPPDAPNAFQAFSPRVPPLVGAGPASYLRKPLPHRTASLAAESNGNSYSAPQSPVGDAGSFVPQIMDEIGLARAQNDFRTPLNDNRVAYDKPDAMWLHVQEQRIAQAAWSSQPQAPFIPQQCYMGGPGPTAFGGSGRASNSCSASGPLPSPGPAPFAHGPAGMPMRSMGPGNGPLRTMSPGPMSTMSPAPMRTLSPGPMRTMSSGSTRVIIPAGPGMAPPRTLGFPPSPGMAPSPRQQMMLPPERAQTDPKSGYNSSETQGHPQGGWWGRPSPQPQFPQALQKGILPPSPRVMHDALSSPNFAPPQGHITPTGPRRGSPGQMPFHGQAF